MDEWMERLIDKKYDYLFMDYMDWNQPYIMFKAIMIDML